MKHAKFSYQLTTQGSRRCLVITEGKEFFEKRMSVVEDIERVINDIEPSARIRAEEYVIVISGVDGRWDGYNARTNKFVFLNTADWPAAVRKYVAEELQPQHA